MLEVSEKSLEVDRHIEYNRMAWHGEVHKGILCTYVEAEFAFDNPFQTQDALVPLRILNRSRLALRYPSRTGQCILARK